MPCIFVDFTSDESHWGGQIDIDLRDHDAMTGEHHAIAIGDHQLILTTPQLCTLYDLLDGWMNGGPARVIGDVRQRIVRALVETVKDHGGAIRAMNKAPEELAHVLADNMKLHGLRFRLSSDEPIAPYRTKASRPTPASDTEAGG